MATDSNDPLRSAAKIPLGNRDQLTELFSYPNHPSHQDLVDITTLHDGIDCSRQESKDNKQQSDETAITMSLEQTIQHYLETSMKRDGYLESKMEILTEPDDSLHAAISGNAAIPYSRAVPKFLKIGKLGLQACQQIQADGLWRDNWRFFLPLGLPLTQHWTVELLHFPPIYTLEEDQDYLASRSTQRWGQLLEINNRRSNNNDDDGSKCTIPNTNNDSNDLKERSPKNDHHHIESNDRFQAIIDIVPIAAPSSDGKNMKDVYPYFEEYIRASLQFWASCDSDDQVAGAPQDAKPVIAFGWPVKCWVETNQAQDGECNNTDTTSQASTATRDTNEKEQNPTDPLPLSVLSLARLPIGWGRNLLSPHAPVLIANHPSYLYNAGRRMGANTMVSLGDDDSALLERIMTEDLIAARWQVEMGLDPCQDAGKVLQESCDYWRDASRNDQIHQLINKQAFILQES